LTPGAQRALDAAALWSSGSDQLRLPEVLLGLLEEPECRAALLLAGYQIDAAAVHERFPALVQQAPQPGRGRTFSDEWLSCLAAAEALLFDYPRPLELATEHLLLGLVASDNEVSRWLAEHGMYAEALEAEVHRLAGHQPGPLPLELEGPVPKWVRVGSERPSVEPRSSSIDRLATLRILDAAANRAGEGLRVVEDYLRFALDDRHLTETCKNLRHALADALSEIPQAERHAARDTQADVGTEIRLATEQDRDNAAEVAQASFKRVEQALRSLEEYAKTSWPGAAAAIEQLRYRVYTLERATDITRASLERLESARLYVLVDGGESIEAFSTLVASLVSAGVSILQLRDKRLGDRELLERARRLRELTAGSETLFVMNDRPDLAALSGADGVHVGQEELSVRDARRIVGAGSLVGVSTHSIEQARAAVLDGADYIGVGPTFPSGTKHFDAFTGCELLASVQAEIRLPAFAIGGITAENLPQVLATGCTRIAVSGAVTGSSDPAASARQLLTRLGGG
jgi:thiamine-phosphate pyrophosphorylase